ncbi:hypothetical protein [Spirosoma aerolatum]|uniref:hypothetical protein n=1 Tax=Spirosoma aerolatum TaxID=1211326 RepID=UPI0009ADED98|nr:hypothetical protein [Spirosoma aerolatum]
MSVIKSYKISGSNLELEEYLHWGFQPNQPDAVQVWILTNVDASDLDVSKLEKLVAFQEDADYEQQSVGNRSKLTISTYLDDAVYTFTCDKIATQKRPYNSEELTTFLMRHIESYQKQEEVFAKQGQFLDEVKKFVERAVDKKARVIEGFSDIANRSRVKAEHQLEILNELQAFMRNSKFK